MKLNGFVRFFKLFFIAAFLMAGTFIVCIWVVEHPDFFPSLGLKWVDVSQAPQKLIVRQGKNYQQEISGSELKSICIGLIISRRGNRFGSSGVRGYVVKVKTKSGQLIPVSSRFDSPADVNKEVKKIAEVYKLPFDTCF